MRDIYVWGGNVIVLMYVTHTYTYRHPHTLHHACKYKQQVDKIFIKASHYIMHVSIKSRQMGRERERERESSVCTSKLGIFISFCKNSTALLFLGIHFHLLWLEVREIRTSRAHSLKHTNDQEFFLLLVNPYFILHQKHQQRLKR